MPQFCSSCGAQMADGVATCGACGKTGGTNAAAANSGGLDPKVAGLLAYLFVPAIVFLLIEPYNKDKTIRFHSFQGLFLGLTSIAGQIVLSVIPIIGWIIIPFFTLGVFVLAIVCAVKAYQGSKFKLPILGDLAEKQANA